MAKGIIEIMLNWLDVPEEVYSEDEEALNDAKESIYELKELLFFINLMIEDIHRL